MPPPAWPSGTTEGIVCYITVAGFSGWARLPERCAKDLRRSCSDYLGDRLLSGKAPAGGLATRVFQGVQQPVCIVLAAKPLGNDREKPAHVRYSCAAKGSAGGKKFKALDTLSLAGPGWADAPQRWREPFFPAATGDWSEFPALKDFFSYDVLRCDAGTDLGDRARWAVAGQSGGSGLIAEKDPEKKGGAVSPASSPRRTRRQAYSQGCRSGGLPATKSELGRSAMTTTARLFNPVRYGFRSLDPPMDYSRCPAYQNQPNPTLWKGHSPKQVHLTALERARPKDGACHHTDSFDSDLDLTRAPSAARVFPLLGRQGSEKLQHSHPLMLNVWADSCMASRAARLAWP